MVCRFTICRAQGRQTKTGLVDPRVTDVRLRCKRCDQVIGVYEPIVVVTDGRAQTTSIAADGRPGDPGERYHRACFVEAHGEDPDRVP